MQLPEGTEIHEVLRIIEERDGCGAIILIAITVHTLAGLKGRELYTITEGSPALPEEAMARPILCTFMQLFDGGEL